MAIVELARYRLVPGADPTTLAEIEQTIQREIGPKHPGYLGRELLQTLDGGYVLIMHWENEQASASWNNTLFASEAGQKLGPLVDRASMSMEKLTTVMP